MSQVPEQEEVLEAPKVQVLEAPVKSDGDKKEYRVIKLPNGLKALLIRKVEENSSDDADQEILAAANLTVGVGSFDDPPNVGGLAHFLEHMLFMGSEKYPDDGEYNQFISTNGGSNNAMTENEYTTFFFDVSENAFPEALDRFAQQFISPLLLKDSLQREREAVDSEFQMASTRDYVRNQYFYKTFVNSRHSASFFDYGNLVTLKDEITDDELFGAVREFLKKFVANNMYLSIQSKRTLDEMQELVAKTFSDIKSGDVVARTPQTVAEIFKLQFHTKMYFLKPKKEAKILFLTWYSDPLYKHYKCNPLEYLKAILRNQGEGGIVNYLRERKLALTIVLDTDSQSFESNSMFTLLKVKVQLTEFGLQNVDKILEAIFSYLLMMKETLVDDHLRLYNELKEKREMDFKFHKEGDAADNCFQGSLGLKYFDNADILRGESLYLGFDERVIFDIINTLNERKFNLIIVTDKHEKYDKKEKYFGIEYDELDIPEEYERLWNDRKANPDFFLQKPNPFKATNFEIFLNEEESPVSYFDVKK